MCIDACSISSCGIDVALMRHDEFEHASMRIGETLVCIDAWGDWVVFALRYNSTAFNIFITILILKLRRIIITNNQTFDLIIVCGSIRSNVRIYV